MSWYSVYQNCKEIMDFIRSIIEWIVTFLTDSEMFNKLSEQVAGVGAMTNITSAIKSTAITLCVLFFMIDFFQKSLHLQWVTWENIMMFFLKLFLARLFINNVGGIMAMIQNGFASMIGDTGLTWSLSFLIFPPKNDLEYFLSGEALARAESSADVLWGDIDVMAGFYNIGITIVGLIMKIVFIIAAIIVIARIFELLVYTVIAPIPFATFSCEGLQDVGKGFLKSYAAVCLQAVVIVVMMIVYSVLLTDENRAILHLSGLGQGVVALLMTFIFGAGVMQSGNWAKKFCGAM